MPFIPMTNYISSNTTMMTGGIQTLVWQDTTPADTEYDSEDSNSYVKSQSSDMKMSMK